MLNSVPSLSKYFTAIDGSMDTPLSIGPLHCDNDKTRNDSSNVLLEKTEKGVTSVPVPATFQ